jgi:hypothetical protein
MEKNRKASVSAVLSVLNQLNDEQMLAMTDHPDKVKNFLAGLVSEDIANTYVVPLSDNEVREQYQQFAEYLNAWRKAAMEMDYRGPVAWKVKEGFTLLGHAPSAGHCRLDFTYLVGDLNPWKKRLPKDDKPTKNSVVFWIPRLADESTGKNIKKMEAHRAVLRQKFGLPEHHCDQFGSSGLLCGLIFAHFKRTGQKVPLKKLFAVSDTPNGPYAWLCVGGFSSTKWGLNSFVHEFDNQPRHAEIEAKIGFFLLGVDELD